MQNVPGTGQDRDPSSNSCQVDVTMTIDDPCDFLQGLTVIGGIP